MNLLATRKREHSRKPDEQYDKIERMYDVLDAPAEVVAETAEARDFCRWIQIADKPAGPDLGAA